MSLNVEKFIDIVGADFYTGVPDSKLKDLCNYLIATYGAYNPRHHIIAANEGNCTAIAAGYHLATGKIPVVYMQNSGEGNIINPAASLLNDHVYGIPMIFVVGWRGEPGVHDEPQHEYQGMITVKLLEDMDMKLFIIDKDTTYNEVAEAMVDLKKALEKGKQVAFVIRKDVFEYTGKVKYENENTMLREQIIQQITAVSGSDPIVTTTGKTSRELFEIRESNHQEHGTDFLTVGSMGHCSSIALGIALQKPETKVWCIDGDGAALMHMGAMAVIAHMKPGNLVHIVINNGAHESVGGQPTVMGEVNISKIAMDCGYPHAVIVDNFEDLNNELIKAKESKELYFIEVTAAIGSRPNLGRPTISAMNNKENFMAYLKTL